MHAMKQHNRESTPLYPDGKEEDDHLYPTHASFADIHRTANQQMIDYLWLGRANGQKLAKDTFEELDAQNARFLYANNAEARIKFAEAAVRRFCSIEQELPEDAVVAMVTLTPRQYATSLKAAEEFDVLPLQAWARQMLRGFNGFGMVEAALYARRKFEFLDNRGTVSWHSHTFHWNFDREEMKDRMAEINSRSESLIPGCPAAHVTDPINRQEFAPRLRYMLKGQLNEYHDWPRKGEVIDPETGEITVVETGRYRNAKRALRKGNQVRMARVMADRTLDKLAFAGGDEGRVFLKGLREEVLRPYKAWEKEQPWNKSGH
jgi:hypothetical protein